ncbi:hypothetical protein E2C01_059775 [Portunus trituberculatus]|uniref:Uncharacterized protein n=1 Tax=Portunus trituberculatus TaxID=210409 RepID=A0A5B7H8R4_PORTR|nr:hypothetical protein [Portunus trituberculatus]
MRLVYSSRVSGEASRAGCARSFACRFASASPTTHVPGVLDDSLPRVTPWVGAASEGWGKRQHGEHRSTRHHAASLSSWCMTI